jgi:hypothetical protein
MIFLLEHEYVLVKADYLEIVKFADENRLHLSVNPIMGNPRAWRCYLKRQ